MGRRHVEDDLDEDVAIDEAEESGVATDVDDDEDDDDGWVTRVGADVDDEDDDLEDDPEAHNSEDREFTGEPAKEPEPSVRETFTSATLQGLRGKGRDKPLSAQSNQWVLSTIGRLTTAGVEPGSPVANDLKALMEAADKRGLIESLGAATHAEVERIVAGKPADFVELASAAPAYAVVDSTTIVDLPLDQVDPDPEQARDEGADYELADSIQANGVLQPILVRPHPRAGEFALKPNGTATAHPAYMIVDGERRYRGAVKAGFTTIRARVTSLAADVGDRLLQQTLLNDGKRLKPMEEARTWKRILEAKGWSAAQLATAVGRPKSTISDRLAILDAPAAFVPLFIDGTLTTAAAPIVRQFADVPAEVLERVVEEAQNDWQWEDAKKDGKPVALADVKRVLEQLVFEEELAEIPRDFDGSYAGEVVTIKGKRYAVRRATDPKTPAAPAAKREPDRYAQQQRAQMKAAKKKSELRRAQFGALSQKLPTSLDANWSLFLVTHLVDELTTDGMRNAVKALGLEPAKGSVNGGFTSGLRKAILGHAAMLPNAGARLKLALQLLLANDLYVSPHSSSAPKRLGEAAKLLKVDLAKIKLPSDEEKPAKPTTAKKAGKRTPIGTFMKPLQPDAALAAIVGSAAIPRTTVTTKLWAYIKKHGLQDAKERRMINADDKLKPVFGGKKRVSMFEMTNLINKHLS